MNARLLTINAVSLWFALQITISQAQEIDPVVVEPQGEFADIDTAKSIEALRKLNSLSGQVITQAIKEITANPDDYAPPVLYTLADRVFRLGKKEEAAFFFYLGQVRGRSDANKSTDESARSAIAALNMQFGEPINQFVFKDLDVMKATVGKVVAWDRDHDRHYDPRWIALHGLSALTESEIAFEPEDKWKEINEQTRKEWQKGFEEVHAQGRRFDQDGDGKLSEEESNAWRDSYLSDEEQAPENENDGTDQ